MLKPILFFILGVFTVQAQQISHETIKPDYQSAEVLYQLGMNVDSLDKVSHVPQLLFIPGKIPDRIYPSLGISRILFDYHGHYTGSPGG